MSMVAAMRLPGARFHPRAALLLVLALVAQLAPPTPLLIPRIGSSMRAESIPSDPLTLPGLPPPSEATFSTPRSADPRPIPSDLRAAPELTAQRSLMSATFSRPDGSFAAIVSVAPMHFRDLSGVWRIINPAIRQEGDSFVVTENGIRTRAEKSRAAFSVQSGETGLHWQSSLLGWRTATGELTLLATAGRPAASRIESASTSLHYSGNWSDPSLSETLISAPNSIEQIVVVTNRQSVPAEAVTLDYETVIRLSPGATWLIDGQPQVSAFETSQALDLEAGGSGIRFEAAEAFEIGRRGVSVAGSYLAEPIDGNGTWRLTIRTPASWWSDPHRVFPAAIDPTMTVKFPTGTGSNGLAWVSDGAVHKTEYSEDNLFRVGKMLLGAGNQGEPFRSYVQFNSMPAPLWNSSVRVMTATLDISPHLDKKLEFGYFFNGTSSYGKGAWPDFFAQQYHHRGQLVDLNHCTGGVASCNGFSLKDATIANNPQFTFFNRPDETGHLLEETWMTVASHYGGGEGQLRSWNVTSAIRNWYNGARGHGPLFGMYLTSVVVPYLNITCPVPNSYQHGWYQANGQELQAEGFYGECVRFAVDPDEIQLRIDYAPMVLPAGASNINKPGVPSYLKIDGQEAFENTNHRYSVPKPAGGDRWRAVATRANADLGPGVDGTVGLNLLRQQGSTITPVAVGGARDSGVLTGAPRSSYVLIDDRNPNLAGASLFAEVVASQENGFSSDLERNYRIEHVSAGSWAGRPGGIPDSIPATEGIIFGPGSIITLREFTLTAGYSVGIDMFQSCQKGEPCEPYDLSLGLARPTLGESGFLTFDTIDHEFVTKEVKKNIDPTSNYHYAFTVERSGVHALVFAHGVPTALSPPVVITLWACPPGTIITGKYRCQPLVQPHGGGLPAPYSAATPSRTALGQTVYSEGGFADLGSGNWCTTNENLGAPLIGPSPDQLRWVVVAQGSVCRIGSVISTTKDSGIALALRSTTVFIDQTTRAMVVNPIYLYGDASNWPHKEGDPSGEVRCVPITGSSTCNRFMPATSARRLIAPFTLWGSSFVSPTGSASQPFVVPDQWIELSQARLFGLGSITVPVAVDSLQQPLTTGFSVTYEHYPNATASYSYTFAVTINQNVAWPSPVTVGGLEVRLQERLDWTADGKFRTAVVTKGGTPKVAEIHSRYAAVTQPIGLGGASKHIKAVIQPPGRERFATVDDPGAPAINCGENRSCFDLRPPDYQWNNGQNTFPQRWEMPDIHIAGNAGTVAVSEPGDLRVFSADHPLASTALNQSFSFDSWGATVKVTEAPCLPGPVSPANPAKTVIEGKTSFAIPAIASDGAANLSLDEHAGLVASFKLCDGALNSVSLALNIDPLGLPIGSSGLEDYFIEGTVTVGPASTRIEMATKVRTIGSDTLRVRGKLTIDTAGFFSLQATGELFGGIFTGDVTLAVSWQPLDILYAGEVRGYGGMIVGSMKMHAWIGQGWQGKYSWLPADNAFHFAGSMSSKLIIPEDVIIWWVPPTDIEFGVSVAFGEFCKNASCTQYAWGISAKATVLGYDVGIYADASGTIDIILGTDDHVLIDEAGPPSVANEPLVLRERSGPLVSSGPPGSVQPQLKAPFRSAAESWPVTPVSACTPSPDVNQLRCPFTVKAGAGRALFMVTWQNGPMVVTLIAPDGSEIIPNNLGAYGAIMVDNSLKSPHQVSYAVQPTGGVPAGTWYLRLSGPALGAVSPGYKHNFRLTFATDPPPPTISWTSPAILASPDSQGNVNLSFQVARNGQAYPVPKIELFYLPAALRPVDASQAISDAILIRAFYNTTDNHLTWNTSSLANGDYIVGARVDDTQRGNGPVFAWAPGTIRINDTVAPPIPIFATKSVTDANLLIVDRQPLSKTADFAGYLISYTIPLWDSNLPPLNRTIRVLPQHPDALGAKRFETIRLGGLLNGLPTTICVRSYDFSGNVSLCTPVTVYALYTPQKTPSMPGPILFPRGGAPGLLNFSWALPSGGSPVTGYHIAYVPTGCLVPDLDSVADQGPSPITVGPVLSYTLTGLSAGQRYRITVRAFDATGMLGPPSTAVGTFGGSVDLNGDGIIDSWATAWKLPARFVEFDFDELTNAQESILGANPYSADSDDDHAYDGEELAAGTDPCDPESVPRFAPKPRAVLGGQREYHFAAAPDHGRRIGELDFYNVGAQGLSCSLTSSQSWLRVTPATLPGPSRVSIQADPAGLAPGRYRGTVSIRCGVERTSVDVVFDVLQPTVPFGVMYLPIVAKGYLTGGW